MGELGNSANLLFLILIASGCYMVANLLCIDIGRVHGRDIRKPKPLGKRLVEFGLGFTSAGNPAANVDTIYSAGHKEPLRDGKTFVFRAKIGWRLAYPVFWAFVLYLLLRDGIPSVIDLLSFMVLSAGAVGLGLYVWSFRIEVEGHELRSMDVFFRMNRFDLARLDRVDDFDDSYVLHFEGGRRAPIPRYVKGHDALRGLLPGSLDINGR